MRAVAYRQAAQAHAISGDPTGCARALQQAYELAAQAPNDENDIARYRRPSYIEMEAANCWVELERPKEPSRRCIKG